MDSTDQQGPQDEIDQFAAFHPMNKHPTLLRAALFGQQAIWIADLKEEEAVLLKAALVRRHYRRVTENHYEGPRTMPPFDLLLGLESVFFTQGPNQTRQVSWHRTWNTPGLKRAKRLVSQLIKQAMGLSPSGLQARNEVELAARSLGYHFFSPHVHKECVDLGGLTNKQIPLFMEIVLMLREYRSPGAAISESRGRQPRTASPVDRWRALWAILCAKDMLDSLYSILSEAQARGLLRKKASGRRKILSNGDSELDEWKKRVAIHRTSFAWEPFADLLVRLGDRKLKVLHKMHYGGDQESFAHTKKGRTAFTSQHLTPLLRRLGFGGYSTETVLRYAVDAKNMTPVDYAAHALRGWDRLRTLNKPKSRGRRGRKRAGTENQTPVQSP
jgi:hypothetical protein